MIRWTEEIVSAFEAMEGVACYSDLYEYIARTTDRTLTKEWKATVRRAIEDHSSDSMNYRAENLFKKVGHGHWALRDRNISKCLLEERRQTSPQDVVRKVFVCEHWRGFPGDGPSSDEDYFNNPLLEPAAAWCTNTHLEVELRSGARISVPLRWFAKLSGASSAQCAAVELSPYGLHWDDLDEDISVKSMLVGPTGTPEKKT